MVTKVMKLCAEPHKALKLWQDIYLVFVKFRSIDEPLPFTAFSEQRGHTPKLISLKPILKDA